MPTKSLSFPGSIILILLQSCLTIYTAQNNSHCRSSSCGDITINYPFRLKTAPQNCGYLDTFFVLDCQNNQTILNSKSRAYHVQAIHYSNYTIRLSDPGLDSQNYSSCPIYSSIEYDLSTIYIQYIENIEITFVNCIGPVKNPLYVVNAFCGNISTFSNSSGVHSYVSVGSILISDIEERCTFDRAILASAHGPIKDNTSYSSIHDLLAYGFDLLWYRAMCSECESSKGACSIEKNEIRCRHYCYEDTPFSERSFLCKLEFYAPYIVLIGSSAIGVIIGLRCLCGLPFLLGLVVFKWRRRHLSMDDTLEDFLQHQNNLMPIKYTYSEIKKMTNNFKDKLGEGGYGTVFKGKLRSGPFVAVKMMANSVVNDKEFISEVATIGRIHHVNVLQPVGFCIEGAKRALVYEYMTRGSLDKYVFSQDGTILLSYKKLFEISLGVARGIDYLHRGCHMQILHFDIKPHNILLDENFDPKISDFGLAKLYSRDDSVMTLTAARGTMGYMAPELFYKNIGRVSHKADIYSFGMLLMEMVGRRKTLNPFADSVSQIYFPSWIYDQLNEGNDLAVQDATEEETKMTKKMILVALWCIQMNPVDRPSMNRVLEMLEGDADLVLMPQKPFLIPFEKNRDDEIYTSPTEAPILSGDTIENME